MKMQFENGYISTTVHFQNLVYFQCGKRNLVNTKQVPIQVEFKKNDCVATKSSVFKIHRIAVDRKSKFRFGQTHL